MGASLAHIHCLVRQPLHAALAHPMKEYRLVGWPELRPPFMRTAHRRLLAEMSQRHVTSARLARASGLRPHEVHAFLDMLEAKGLVACRERSFAERFSGSLQLVAECARRWSTRKARSLFD